MRANPAAMPTRAEFQELSHSFSLLGVFRAAVPHGNGHINDTFAVTMEQAGARVRYILQRINPRVFKAIPDLMENIQRVTAHAGLRASEAAGADGSRRALTLVPARDGSAFYCDAGGGCWRCYLFVEGARTHDVVENVQQAREAARAFGEFQMLLVDLPGQRLHETIPHFHDTRARFDALAHSAAADRCHRAREISAELAFVRQREGIVDRLLGLQAQGRIPERVTHNDTKLNNVMIDDLTGAAICVIDLDTVMPGLALYDFGDMVRSATNSGLEDESDTTRVHARLAIFEALVEGYLSSARSFLNPVECAHLTFSGRLITFEIGMRFLTDYLNGDVYFKTVRPGQNLDRARTQFALLSSMEAQEAQMEEIVRRHTGG